MFAQATDTRPEELKAQGVRPRVWFGERWITSIFDLFEENVRYFPTLLPELSDEDPRAELNAGRTPLLPELRLQQRHRTAEHRPGLRRRQRPPPPASGEPRTCRQPTVVDMMANAAFYYGLLRNHLRG